MPLTLVGIMLLLLLFPMVLQPFYWVWALFQYRNPTHGRWNLLDGASVRHKASTYTHDNTNRINAHSHSTLEWDSNPQTLCLSGQNAQDSDRTATVIG
jgi:hypothetical protein